MMFTFMLSVKKGSVLKVENGSANIVTLDKDQPYSGSEGGLIGVGTSELPIRNQFRAWHEYMREGSGQSVSPEAS
jgi:hypothetical protein